MKEIIVISGKGGTGKTTITASLAYLFENNIIADCDVDASNLNILFDGIDEYKEEFSGAKVAKIDTEKCINCGKCIDICRFNAIEKKDKFYINSISCEGCGACKVFCPNDAIKLEDEITAEVLLTKSKINKLSSANMKVGSEGSGKLVTKVRALSKKHIENEELIIIDGSPGIGCAVMASITGCSIALIVTEPTLSGLSDMKRILQLIRHFNVKPYACINKYDINLEKTKEIENYLIEEKVELLSKIPFDEIVPKSINERKVLIEYDESIAANEILKLYEKLKKIIEEDIL